jgi:hypothetical protein
MELAMNIHAREFATGAVEASTRPAPAAVIAAAQDATRKVAPLWPLKHFVAVNPYLGLIDRPFSEAAGIVAETTGARMLMPATFYLSAVEEGRITDADIADALAASGRPAEEKDVADVKRRAAVEPDPDPTPLPTFADVVSEVTGRDVSAIVVDRVSAWAAGYFDEGQALWPMLGRDLSPFPAWRLYASKDRTARTLGISGVRAYAESLSTCAENALTATVDTLDLPAEALPRYFHRLVLSVGGWAAFARYKVWETELRGGTDDTLFEFLVIRAAWDAALAKAFADDADVTAAWKAAVARMAEPAPAVAFPAPSAEILHAAYEIAFQRELVAGIGTAGAETAVGRPDVQAAFCIDVRSEIFRRALEETADGVETLGFAGFFGVPLEVVPFGEAEGGAHCPVLFTPSIVVPERLDGPAAEEEAARRRLATQRRTKKAWTWFKNAAVSSFAFVETLGLAYVVKLARDSLGRPAKADEAVPAERLIPSVEPGAVAGRATGIAPDQRLEIAATVLTAMSLTKDFARIVLLAGHGSTTANNPHATGLDCGACGGHTGEANARVTAAILNDPHVRKGLAARGLPVPEDTIFLAGLHDTTTDDVRLLDTDAVPASHADDLARLKERLAAAGAKARRERARLLGLSPSASDLDAAVTGRSHDWSQVRPEWGLAGCAAFIAAPRERTKSLPLEGRAFLHTYDWRADDGFSVLELIMTAPVVVASWISLQYYGSTVDNRVFGSGNKVLHNVVGTLGVLEGNTGDLRTGLPWQSVHDGERFVHEPVRLNVVIEAPVDAMNAVIEKSEMVRHLLDNGWLHLFAIGEDGRVAKKYDGGFAWRPVADVLAPAEPAE